MKRKRHTPEEIIKKLREAAGLIAGGKTAEEAARQIGVSVPTYHRWKEQHGGAEKSTVKRLKELEKENLRLKKLGKRHGNDHGIELGTGRVGRQGCPTLWITNSRS
jgi:transposase-like protein